MSRRGRDHRDSPARSESDQDSASDSDVFETPATGHSSESEPDWEDNENLGTYYGKLDRVDDKEVTLSLHKRTIRLFFEKILGKGELDRDGRELLRDRYYLSPSSTRSCLLLTSSPRLACQHMLKGSKLSTFG